LKGGDPAVNSFGSPPLEELDCSLVFFGSCE